MYQEEETAVVQVGGDKVGPGWGQCRWGHEARFWRPGRADRCTGEKKRHPAEERESTVHY